MFNPLSPEFLVNNIQLIGLATAVMLLVIFDEFVSGTIIFPFADFLKTKVFEKAMSIEKIRRYKKVTKYTSEFIATTIFILYCYAGYALVAEYVLIPVLTRLKNIILLVVLIIFFLVSYVFNSHKLRRKFLRA